MKHTILLILLVFLTTGCKTHNTVQQSTLPVVPIETNTDTKTVHIETIDTVFIETPLQSAERTTPGRESHLETDYAESNARINEDGTLTHTLHNKQVKIPVPVRHSSDTVYVNKYMEKPVTVEVYKAVERKLTSWQKIRLNTWVWLAISIVICIGWILRKPIINLARRFLTNTKKP